MRLSNRTECKVEKKGIWESVEFSCRSTMVVSLVGNALNEQPVLLLHCPKLDWAESQVGQKYKGLL